jgi:DNA-binding transcriptional ArsR family regulator/uncharacterized protein YndB with AHSA1/START domain
MAAYPGMDEVFRALADPSRRRLLDSLNARTGQTLRELCAELDMARQSVSKHLDILEAANLVTTVRRGREKLHYLNGDPINEIGERWINRYERPRVEALADLKRALEAPMDKPTFVYTSYIRTTPERLWQALTEPAFTRRYWGLAIESDWQPGSAMTWNQFGITNADPEQVVLEADPYTRLAYTWHTMTPELMERVGVDADTIRELVTEPRSQVTFSLEPQGEMVKLTVIHEGLGEVTRSLISEGWPSVLSNLKTLLETGEPLPDPRLAERAGATA